MAREFFRLVVVGALMFSGGIGAASVLQRPSSIDLPLMGTQCVGAHCGPATYQPLRVANVKNQFPPVCPKLQMVQVTQTRRAGIEEANYASVDKSFLEGATSEAAPTIDALLAAANRNIVVSTTDGGTSSIVFVLYKCSSTGLSEQFVRVPYDMKRQITIETIRVRQPSRR